MVHTNKHLPAIAGMSLIPGSRKSRRRKWQPTPVFFPGESYGQRSLVGYSPQGREESTECPPDTSSIALCDAPFHPW